MDLDPSKATFCLFDMEKDPKIPIVLHQHKLVSNNSPISMYQSGQGLLYVARNTTIELTENWSNSETHKGIKNFAFLSTAAINYSFAAELFLKGIMLMSKGNYNKGHNLKQLFHDLNEDIKTELESLVQSLVLQNNFKKFVLVKSKPEEKFEIHWKYKKSPSIIEFLEEHEKPFVEWRYYFEFSGEAKTMIYDLQFMDSFVVALFEKLGTFEDGNGARISGETIK
jgi:HEPN domain-containing protein